MDSEIGPFTDHNAQSVLLEAPRIGNSQSNFSAFLNNGLTSANDLLQNGLLFDLSRGSVVWTDEAHGLSPQYYNIDYHVGDDYYFTVSYTNDHWWLCASNQSRAPSNYQCARSSQTDGTTLWGGDNTSVWFENQNSNYDWYQGFTDPVIAHMARNYMNGTSSYWSREIQEITFCGTDYPDDYNAISGTLVNNGTAEFHLIRVPLLCP